MKKLVVVVVLAACGGGGGTSSTDGGSDVGSSVDAPIGYECDPTTPEGIVIVQNLAPSTTVLSHDASGALLHRENVPVHATPIAVPGCGSITVVEGDFRKTVMGVQPGETIWVMYNRDHPDGPATSVANVVIDQPVTGATYYFASAGHACDGYLVPGAGTDLPIYYTGYCVPSSGLVTVLVWVSKPGAPIYAVFEDVSLAQTAQTPLRVTSWQTSPVHHLTTTLATPATGIEWVMYPIADGIAYPHATSTGASGISTTFDLDLAYYELGDAASSRVKLLYGNRQTRMFEQILATPLPAQINEQVEPRLLPTVRDPMRDTDLLRPTLSFTVDSTSVEEDLVEVVVPTRGGTGWHVYAPPGTRSVRLPEMPTDLQFSFPSTPIDVRVRICESTDVAGYRDARQNPTRFEWATNAVPRLVTTGTVVRDSTVNWD